MAWRPGDRVNAADIFEMVDWTPTYTGVTAGTGAVNEGWYHLIGMTCFWGFRLQFGTSPSWTSSIRVDLPFAAWTGGGTALQMTIGTWTFRDTSATAHYSGSMGIWAPGGADVSFAGAWTGTAPSRRLEPGNPATVAVDDVLSGSGAYRIA